MNTSLLIVDDHEIVREGLRQLLEKENDFRIIGECSNGNDAVRLALELQPDVIVMDVTMPDFNGVSACHRIKSRAPAIKIVALSMHVNRQIINSMFRAGASAYVVKSDAVSHLIAAIRRTRQGETYLSQVVADVVVHNYVQHLGSIESQRESPLSTRESEVLQLIAEGRPTRQIAQRLHVSVNTVDTHKRHIMQKTGHRSIAELTKYAIREGLSSLDT